MLTPRKLADAPFTRLNDNNAPLPIPVTDPGLAIFFNHVLAKRKARTDEIRERLVARGRATFDARPNPPGRLCHWVRRPMYLQDAQSRLASVCLAARASGYVGDGFNGIRGVMYASKLLGVVWNVAECIVADFGNWGHEGLAVWRPYVSEPVRKYVGEVYIARLRDDDRFLKIGFTSIGARERVKRVSTELKRPLELVRAFPGTILDEWAIHQSMPGQSGMIAEWYRASDVMPELIVGLPGQEARP